MGIQKLQQELLKAIFNIITIESDNRAAVEAMKERALEIINSLRDHINDNIEYRNRRMTALDYIIFFDTRGNNPTRKNSPVLLELERVIKDAGGKTTQELMRNFPKRSGSNRIGWRLLENANVEPVRAKFSQHLQNST